VLKAYGIRVYCIDRQTIAPLISYFTIKFKCLLGLLVTGRDKPRTYSGLMIFGGKGARLIGEQVSSDIERSMFEYVRTQTTLVDLSPLFDYSSKKVRFKPDNYTDATMKSYIKDMEEKYLLSSR
jgi:phosphomannomutase